MRKKLLGAMLMAGALSLGIPVGATPALNTLAPPFAASDDLGHLLKGGAQTTEQTITANLFGSQGVTDAANMVDGDSSTKGTFLNWSDNYLLLKFGGDNVTITEINFEFGDYEAISGETIKIAILGASFSSDGSCLTTGIDTVALEDCLNSPIELTNSGNFTGVKFQITGSNGVQIKEITIKGRKNVRPSGTDTSGGDSGSTAASKLTTTFVASAATNGENANDGDLSTYATFSGENSNSWPIYVVNFDEEATITKITFNYGEGSGLDNGKILVTGMPESGSGVTLANNYPISYENGGSQVLTFDNTQEFKGCQIYFSCPQAWSLNVNEITIEGVKKSASGGDTGGDTGGAETIDTLTSIYAAGILTNSENAYDGNLNTYATFKVNSGEKASMERRFDFEGGATIREITFNYGAAEGYDFGKISLYGVVYDDFGNPQQYTPLTENASIRYATEGSEQTFTFSDETVYGGYQMVFDFNGEVTFDINEIIVKGVKASAGDDDAEEEIIKTTTYGTTNSTDVDKMIDGDTSTSGTFTNGNLELLFGGDEYKITEVSLDFGDYDESEASSIRVYICGLIVNDQGDTGTWDLTDAYLKDCLNSPIKVSGNGYFKGCRVHVYSTNAVEVKEITVKGIKKASSGDDKGDTNTPVKLTTTLGDTESVSNPENAIDGDLSTSATFSAYSSDEYPCITLNFDEASTITNVTLNYGEATGEGANGSVFVFGVDETGDDVELASKVRIDYANGGSQTIPVTITDKFVGCKVKLNFGDVSKLNVTEITVEGINSTTGKDTGDDTGDGTLVKVTPTSCGEAGNVTDIEKTIDGDFSTYGTFTSNTVSHAQYNFADPTAVKEITMYFGDVTDNVNWDNGGYLRVDVMGLENVDDGEGEIIMQGYVLNKDSLVLNLDHNKTAYPAYTLVMIAYNGNATAQVKEVVFKAAGSSKGDDTGDDPEDGNLLEMNWEEVKNVSDAANAVDKNLETYATFNLNEDNNYTGHIIFQSDTEVDVNKVKLIYGDKSLSDGTTVNVNVYSVERGVSSTKLSSAQMSEGESQSISVDTEGKASQYYKVELIGTGKAQINVKEIQFFGPASGDDKGDDTGDTGTPLKTSFIMSRYTDSEYKAYDGDLTTYATFKVSDADMLPCLVLAFEDSATIKQVTLNYNESNNFDNGTVTIYGTNQEGWNYNYTPLKENVAIEDVIGGTQTISINSTEKFTGIKVEFNNATLGTSLNVNEITVNGVIESGDKGDDTGDDTSLTGKIPVTLGGTAGVSNAENAIDDDLSTYATYSMGEYDEMPPAMALYLSQANPVTKITLHYGAASDNIANARIIISGTTDEDHEVELVAENIDYVNGGSQTFTINSTDKLKACNIKVEFIGGGTLDVNEVVIENTPDGGDDSGDGTIVEVTPTSCGNASGVTDLEKTMDGDLSTYGTFTANTTASGQYNFADPTVAKEIVVHFGESTMNVGNYGDVSVEVKALKNVDDEEGEIIMSAFYYGAGTYFSTDSLVLDLDRNETAYSAYQIAIKASGGDATLQVKEVVFKAAGSKGDDKGDDTGDKGEKLACDWTDTEGVDDADKAIDGDENTYATVTTYNLDEETSIAFEFDAGEVILSNVDILVGDVDSDVLANDDANIEIYGVTYDGNGEAQSTKLATQPLKANQNNAFTLDMGSQSFANYKVVVSSSKYGNVQVKEISFYGKEAKSTGISSATTTTTEKAAQRYSLDGRPVDSNYKGIVIENGKKILVK